MIIPGDLEPISELIKIPATAPVSSYPFTGLSGDDDDDLYLKFNLWFNKSVESNIYIQCNSDTLNHYYYSVHREGVHNGTQLHQSTSGVDYGMLIANCQYPGNSHIKGWVHIEANHKLLEQVIEREFESEHTRKADMSNFGTNQFEGAWQNSVDNLISLLLTTRSANTFWGILQLFRDKVDKTGI
jgi:hypothetical protein